MTERKTLHIDEGWDYMKQHIEKLRIIVEEGSTESQFNSEEYMIFYTAIYNMCIQKPPLDYSQELYNRYKGFVEQCIGSTVLSSVSDKHDEFMLKELVQRWINHKVLVKWLSRLFSYLDRYFVVEHSLPSLKEVGLHAFHDLVHTKVQANARKTLITLIGKEREGEQIDRSLLKNVLDIFVEIGVNNLKRYENDFEVQMLEDTSDYYKSKATIWIESDSLSNYMLKAEDCLRRERDRVSHYLHASTEQKLVEKVQHELLINCANQLLEKEPSGYWALLRDNKVDDLSRMYRLYHDIPEGLGLLVNLFKQHITNEGSALVQLAEESSSNQVLVRKFIELHDKYMPYVNNCFMNHILFHKALKEAFEVFCNKTVAGSSSPEVFSLFCDNILKRGGSGKWSDEAIEETLEKVVNLLAYISDKDLFAEFYRKKLARRLLFDRSANDYHEKCILTKLKQQNGGQFTSKMEGMVVDLALSKDLQMKFQEYLSENSHVNTGINLTVTVLTTGFWPTYRSSNLNLPSEMVKCVEVFKGFYETRTKQRKLSWIYSLGTCNIIGRFETKPIELIVSTYQAAALLLFNTVDKLSYSEIMSQLGLVTHVDFVRLLHSLACAKYKILLKEPNTKKISPHDSFMFNSKFTDNMSRIKIPLPSVDERNLPSVDERKKVIEVVDKDRRYAIDASIVRIMKSRKVLDHQKLVSECVEQLGRMFKPDIKAIKLRIEDLIKRDYIERDKENPNAYKYLA